MIKMWSWFSCLHFSIIVDAFINWLQTIVYTYIKLIRKSKSSMGNDVAKLWFVYTIVNGHVVHVIRSSRGASCCSGWPNMVWIPVCHKIGCFMLYCRQEHNCHALPEGTVNPIVTCIYYSNTYVHQHNNVIQKQNDGFPCLVVFLNTKCRLQNFILITCALHCPHHTTHPSPGSEK